MVAASIVAGANFVAAANFVFAAYFADAARLAARKKILSRLLPGFAARLLVAAHGKDFLNKQFHLSFGFRGTGGFVDLLVG